MKITLETDYLANIFLKDNTVILDFVNKQGKHERHYHRYKTKERAERYFEIYGTDAVNKVILDSNKKEG